MNCICIKQTFNIRNKNFRISKGGFFTSIELVNHIVLVKTKKLKY